jgi:hypothetical protein
MAPTVPAGGDRSLAGAVARAVPGEEHPAIDPATDPATVAAASTTETTRNLTKLLAPSTLISPGLVRVPRRP